MKNSIFVLALVALFTVGSAHAGPNKIQKQGVKTLADCIAVGATGANCLIETPQLWDTTNSQQLSATIASLATPLSSPLTTKGDLWGYSTVNARIPACSNGQYLTYDSAQTLGVSCATPAGATPLNPQVSSTLRTTAITTWTSATGLNNGSYNWFDVIYMPPQNGISNVTPRYIAVGSGSPNNAAYSTNGLSWTQVATPDPVAYFGAAYSPELGRLVAVGVDKIMTSTDGTSWTARTSPEADAWTSVTWSPELSLFCAVSNSGGTDSHSVMSSPDGITWTTRNGVNNFHWTSVVWADSLGLFVAVGYGSASHIMTSPDCINWTGRTDAGLGQWQRVAWSPDLGMLVAVTGAGAGSGAAMTSTNGTTWTSRTLPGDGTDWRGVTWSPELGVFAAVNRDATVNSIATSTDGITWTGRVAAEQNGWNGITWGAQFGNFMAVSNNSAGTNFAMKSKIVKKFVAP